MLLFEYILQEANKERFFRTLWEKFSDTDENIQSYNISYQDLLNFVNSDDSILKKEFEELGLDWRSNKDVHLKWTAIINSYIERKEKKVERNKKKEIFKAKTFKEAAEATGYKVVETCSEPLSGVSFIHLSDLENEKYDFYVPLSHNACVFCDSVQAGGQGAKWCIGYEGSNGYWLDYTAEGNIFILAVNKEKFNRPDTLSNNLKFMIQLSRADYSSCAWSQDNDPESVIGFEFFKQEFGRSIDEMEVSLKPLLQNTDSVYSKYSSQFTNSHYVPEKKIPIEYILAFSREKIQDYIFEYEGLKTLAIDFENYTRVDNDVSDYFFEDFFSYETTLFRISSIIDWLNLNNFNISTIENIQILNFPLGNLIIDESSDIKFSFYNCYIDNLKWVDRKVKVPVSFLNTKIITTIWPVTKEESQNEWFDNLSLKFEDWPENIIFSDSKEIENYL